MKKKDETRQKFIIELAKLRQRISELEKSEAEHKKAEQALRESKEKFRSIFDSISEALLILDRTGRIIDANEQAIIIYGRPKEEFLGKHFTKLGVISPKDIPIQLKRFRGVLSGNKPTVCIRIKNKKNQEIDLECSATVIKKDNRPISVNVIARDITERKKAEKDLKESEERYRDLVEKADIAIVIDDKEGNFKYFNKKFAELFGYSEGEMKKKSIQTLIHPEDARWVMEFHDARLHGGNIPSRYEFRGVRKDSSTIHLEIDVVELKEGKSIIGTRSYIWDITERKMAEKELRQSEEKFRSVVVNSSDAIISADSKGNIVFWNPAAKNIFGYSSEEAIGKPYEIILPERFHPIFKKNLKQIVLWKKLGIIENRTEMIGLRKDGREFPMEVSLSSWLAKQGIFFSSSIRDITEEKRAKEKFKRKYAELKNSARVNTKGN